MKKFKIYIAALVLVAGLFLLYLDYKSKQQVFTQEIPEHSITIIDLSEQRGHGDIYLILGIVLIVVSVGLVVIPPSDKKTATLASLKDKLTQQEQRVVSLIQQAKTNKEIAIELSISLSTVKTHTNNIYKKLEVSSRQELMKLPNISGF
ncbi:MAG: helix-turn-helix transcriptional regulator [Bacteroidota bacterium]